MPATINKDLRNIDPRDVEGYDAVVHLAELSNDPLGQNNPEVTFNINHHGSVKRRQGRQAGGRAALRLRLLVQRVRPGGERLGRRDVSDESADRVCRMQGPRRTRRRRRWPTAISA